MLAEQKQVILHLFNRVVAPLLVGLENPPSILLERPRDPSHGDVASNVAMQLARPLKKNPRELAQYIVQQLYAQPEFAGLLDGAEIAGPGFINLRLSLSAKQSVVSFILKNQEAYGRGVEGVGKKVMVEFVSANPTGPLHVGHGRQGALGDALSSLLASQGYDVAREFYYNDAGVQIHNLMLSVQARARGLGPLDQDWPANAYNGEYIADIAAAYLAKETVHACDGVPVTASGDVEDQEALRCFAVAYLRYEQDLDLQAFGVKFDHYYLESSLYEEDKVKQTVATLVKAEKTYEQEGALWLRSTEYGDDKDRVMRKSDGTYTYFVPDVAYHVTKWQRGFSSAINIQGSDHHGTIARVRAGLQAMGLGIPDLYPQYVLHKMVTVMKNGEEVKISKRAGSYVTLRDLIEWSAGEGEQRDLIRGRDAVRFFLISRKADTEFVFDVDVALKQSDENPVYYVQYAHARICRIVEMWAGDERSLALADLSSLTLDNEMSLINKLAQYPDMLQHALEELGPHQVAFYLRELAGEFHSYYNSGRILVEEENIKLARLALIVATRQVLRNGLTLLGVSTPNKM
jgi:arginyl-tRNA synthetase